MRNLCYESWLKGKNLIAVEIFVYFRNTILKRVKNEEYFNTFFSLSDV